MLIIKKEPNITDYKWLVWDTKTKGGDVTDTLFHAIRLYLWRLGVPARIAFFEFKGFGNRD